MREMVFIAMFDGDAFEDPSCKPEIKKIGKLGRNTFCSVFFVKLFTSGIIISLYKTTVSTKELLFESILTNYEASTFIHKNMDCAQIEQDLSSYRNLGPQDFVIFEFDCSSIYPSLVKKSI